MTARCGAAQRVALSVPGLGDPPLRSGCCAVRRHDLPLEALDLWPGLLVLEVDPDAATAEQRLAQQATGRGEQTRATGQQSGAGQHDEPVESFPSPLLACAA